MAQPRHAHLILSSPLWHRETVRQSLLPELPADKLRALEENFKLDCILVERLRYKWSPDIIPKYDAAKDPFARHYFRSPMVQSLLRRTLDKEEKNPATIISPWSRNSTKQDGRHDFTSTSPRTRSQQAPSTTTQPLQHSSQSSRPSLNTLSGRRRAPAPPSEAALAERRDLYRIDSVAATNQVTRYKPLVRPYDATDDRHARGYFRKPGVRRVLAITLNSAPERTSVRKDVCKVGAHHVGTPSALGEGVGKNLASCGKCVTSSIHVI